MKQVIFAFVVFLVFTFACTEQVREAPINEIQIADLSKYNMKIIPENPTSSDEIKLVIFADCTYNQLSGVTKNGNTIDIQKQFNSMMKWPCVMQNDTITIGRLTEGTYLINYKLLDLSTQVTNPIALSFSFHLPVSK